MAVVLRIMFAAVTMQLLDVMGLTLAGGLLLLWVCWKLYREIRQQAAEEIGVSALDDGESRSARTGKTVAQATVQVAVADLSMSLDNVLAVAGAADDYSRAMIFGLVLSVILMGVGATFIAHLLQRYQWIAYLGLALIGYVALSMIWRGSVEIVHVAGV